MEMLGFEKMEGLRDSNPFRIAAATISILHLLALSSLFFMLMVTGLYCIASMAGKNSDFRCWLLPILDNFARPFDFVGILGACWLAAVVIPLVRINSSSTIVCIRVQWNHPDLLRCALGWLLGNMG